MDASAWADYGLQGLVIAGMSGFITWMVKLHRDERKEWRDESGTRAEKTDKVLEELKHVIVDLGCEIRATRKD